MILENDLVDCCQPGDDVWITAVVVSRWKSPIAGQRWDVEIALHANNVMVCNQQHGLALTDDLKKLFVNFWNDEPSCISARDKMLFSFCPTVYGMYVRGTFVSPPKQTPKRCAIRSIRRSTLRKLTLNLSKTCKFSNVSSGLAGAELSKMPGSQVRKSAYNISSANVTY